jgi:hypothetical protein
MSRITRNNYESFLLDLSEGSLSAQEMEELFDFFEANPDLAIELDELEAGPRLQTSFVSNKQKQHLVKDKSEEDLLDVLIAEAEGISTKNQKDYLATLMASSPSLKEEARLIVALKLKPSEADQFSKKALFLQDVPLRPYAWIYRSLTAAAVVLLAWLAIPKELPVSQAPLSANRKIGTRATDVSVHKEPINSALPDPATSLNETASFTQDAPNNEERASSNADEFIAVQHEEPIRIAHTSVPQLSGQKFKPKLILPEENNSASVSNYPANNGLMALSETNQVVETTDQLGNKFAVIIDEKFTLAKEDQAIYLRIGRFTVSFVRSIFKRNTNEEKK